MNKLKWLKIKDKLNKEEIINLINKAKEKTKDLSNEILEMPKWWYPIVIGAAVVWFILWTTVLLFLPWTTIIFVSLSVKTVFYIDENMKKIKCFTKEQIKKILT